MLVLRRRVAPQNGVDLCVCHPISGRCSLLPPITVNDRSHVLLPGDDADGSYQLLTVDRAFQIHTFSSKDGSWGGRAVQMPPVGEQTRWLLRSPAVIHGIVYWLALSPGTTVHNRSETVEDYRILAFDVNTLQVTSIGLPPHWQRRCSPLVSPYNLLLAPWTDGRLSLLVSEFNVICMWTLSPAGSWAWAQREVINKGTILRSLEPLLPKPQLCFDIKFEWFGERSGMVIFQLHGIGVVLLNLQTMEVRKLREGQRWSSSLQFCPYEMDFTSWLPTLRSFM